MTNDGLVVHGSRESGETRHGDQSFRLLRQISDTLKKSLQEGKVKEFAESVRGQKPPDREASSIGISDRSTGHETDQFRKLFASETGVFPGDLHQNYRMSPARFAMRTGLYRVYRDNGKGGGEWVWSERRPERANGQAVAPGDESDRLRADDVPALFGETAEEFSDRTGLVLKETTYKQNGKTFKRKQWVRANPEEKKREQPGGGRSPGIAPRPRLSPHLSPHLSPRLGSHLRLHLSPRPRLCRPGR